MGRKKVYLVYFSKCLDIKLCGVFYSKKRAEEVSADIKISILEDSEYDEYDSVWVVEKELDKKYVIHKS